MDIWQKCPVCNGQGIVQEYHLERSAPYSRKTCTTCSGTGMINSIDGSPPVVETTVSRNTGDTLERCVGFKLKIKYPGCKNEVGDFVPLTAGEFFNYPEIWEPVYYSVGIDPYKTDEE